MPAYPVPENEKQRLESLKKLHILDTPAEERFDIITRLAQRLFKVEIVLISLIDENRQWFKSKQGLDISETPREDSFCAHAIMGEDIFYIEDTLKDPRFKNHRLVQEKPFIRLYVGSPLKARDGALIGTLCLIHSEPKKFSEEEMVILKDLSKLAEHHLNSNALNEALEKALRIEKALKERDILYEALFDNTADSIIVLDQDGIIQSINFASERTFGYDQDECVGQNISLFFPTYNDDELKKLITDCPESSYTYATTQLTEVTCRKKNGHIFPGELTRSSMYFEDSHLYIWIVRDTTERKKLDLLKNEFISTVSHELRTPITAIRGSLGLILGAFQDSIPEQPKKLLEIAHSNCERLVRLVNDILDIEKIKVGMLKLKLEKLDLASIVQNVVESNQAYAEQYKVTLAVDNPLGSCFVFADNDRLTQVLTNLLSNAIKYSPQGSTVKLRLERVEKKIKVSVIDQGPGIPTEARKRLFHKFVQLDSSDSRKREGTGLGLSISKAIIEKFGGSLDVDSEVGRGSTFYFFLDEYHHD